MSFLFRMGAPRTRAGQPTSQTLWLGQAIAGAASSSAGPVVTVEKAMGLAAVWAAMNIRSDQIGSLPLQVAKRRGAGRAELVDDPKDNTVRLLAHEPNPEMTPFVVWSQVERDLSSWGNAFLGKERAANGRVIALWPIHPQTVTVGRLAGRKFFDVIRDDGQLVRYGTADVIHIMGRSFDGLVGISPITLHRQSIGHSLALDEFGGNLMRNRGVPQGVLKVKGKLTDPDSKKRLRAEWKARQSGSRQGEIAILDEDAEFDSITMPLGDAQYIEQRKLSAIDASRIIGVPAEMIGADTGESMKYSNVEALALNLVKWHLRGDLTGIAQALSRDVDLFPSVEQRVARFNIDEIVRADLLTRFRAYRIALGANAPFMTAEEARAAEPGLDAPFTPPATAPKAPPAPAG